MRLYRDVAPAMLVASLLALAIVMSVLGCREDESPTAPEAGPALATTSPQPLAFVQVSAGLFHSCGVTTDNRAYCWGQNAAGALGDGTTTFRPTPVAVIGGLRFVQVSAGYEYTCGITTDDRAYCWGENDHGKLGDGTSVSRSAPVRVAGGHPFRQVHAGDYHTCGVTPSYEAFCWGYNIYGQLGDSSEFIQRRTPVRVAGGLSFRRVIAGALYTCGVTTGNRGYCWGDGRVGQIGDGKTYQRRTPRAVAGGLSFRQVVAGGGDRSGGAHSCGVTTDNRAFCWGANASGELGDGTTTQRLKPAAVAGGLQFSGVSPGGEHSCGVTTGKIAYCWGQRYYGQVGDGSPLGDPTPPRLSPGAVTGGLQFSVVSAGHDHSCGVTTAGVAYCWGIWVPLGDGSSTTTSTPVAVAGLM
jgi:alpha-tubulin suppressor-like RCC1 family protein